MVPGLLDKTYKERLEEPDMITPENWRHWLDIAHHLNNQWLR
jgi:hypothetical protein